MKKLLLISLMLFSFPFALKAQNSPLVGTWEGTQTQQVPDPNSDGLKEIQVKWVVRINQYDNDFVVRMKTVPSDNSSVTYYDNNTIIESNSTLLSWSSYKTTDYDCGYIKNGQVVNSTEYFLQCRVSFNNGRLKFTYYMHSIYKNKSGSILGTHDTPSGDIYLYKKDSDW